MLERKHYYYVILMKEYFFDMCFLSSSSIYHAFMAAMERFNVMKSLFLDGFNAKCNLKIEKISYSFSSINCTHLGATFVLFKVWILAICNLL